MTKPFKIDGSKVEDAKNHLVLTITRDDCRLGSKKNSDSCAAARALCREATCEKAKVFLSRVYIKKNGKWLRYVTPQSLRAEIIAFDRGGQFKPGEYTISPVQPTVRLGAPRRSSKTGKVPQRGNRRKPHVVPGIRSRMERSGI